MTGPFRLPRRRVFAIDELVVAFDPTPHPYLRRHESSIEARWRALKEANPRYFDGTILLFSRLELEGRHLSATCQPTRFAAFLHWREQRSHDIAEHCYAHAILVTADGALVAIRMAAGTGNPGRVYFAAGSFDLDDVSGDRVDVAGNMAREVREETGLDISTLRHDPDYHGWSDGHATVLFRRYFLRESAADVVQRVEAHIAADPDPEIDGVVIIRAGEPLPEGLMPQMPALIAWHFDGATGADP